MATQELDTIIFSIDPEETLTAMTLFCKLYNDNDSWQETYEHDANKFMTDMKAGTAYDYMYMTFVKAIFAEYTNGNSKPLTRLPKMNLPGTITVFLDTETSGMGSSDKVIQLAYICRYTVGDLCEEVFTYNEYIDWPGISIHWAAKKIHGISSKTLKEYGLTVESVFKTFNLVSKVIDHLVAYNVAFDRRMIEGSITGDNNIGCNSWSCCLQLAREKLGKGSKKLGDVYKSITGSSIKNAHDALADVRAMIVVWDHLNK